MVESRGSRVESRSRNRGRLAFDFRPSTLDRHNSGNAISLFAHGGGGAAVGQHGADFAAQRHGGLLAGLEAGGAIVIAPAHDVAGIAGDLVDLLRHTEHGAGALGAEVLIEHDGAEAFRFAGIEMDLHGAAARSCR